MLGKIGARTTRKLPRLGRLATVDFLHHAAQERLRGDGHWHVARRRRIAQVAGAIFLRRLLPGTRMQYFRPEVRVRNHAAEVGAFDLETHEYRTLAFGRKDLEDLVLDHVLQLLETQAAKHAGNRQITTHSRLEKNGVL